MAVSATMLNEISSFRQIRNKVKCSNCFDFVKKSELFFELLPKRGTMLPKPATLLPKMATLSKQHLTLSKGRNFTIKSFDIVFGNKVECCFDIVADVDGA